ncbi:MAG: formate acetyltransferase, partial [Ruminococcus sp.]|nr:formate acetyltransferase [Ruminococcus sp.]
MSKTSWMETLDVRDFIVDNYTEYKGDESFLAPPTEKTKKLWDEVLNLMKKEREAGGVLDIDEETISTITSHKPGYIDKELEEIVGLQTDEPLKRAIMPFGGIRMVHTSLKAYGRSLPERIEEIFKYRKTHNDGVFDVYNSEIKKARHSGIITGLPDAYGRGRIIGDYRLVPLFGVDRIIEYKNEEKYEAQKLGTSEENIRHIEEISEQVKALYELKEMAEGYGFDISGPAQGFCQAVQWLYFAYLAAVKEQNGAAMSLGRVSTFLDIYAEKDLALGRRT